MVSVGFLCHCSCNGDNNHPGVEGEVRPEAQEVSPLWSPTRPREEGLISYTCDSKAALTAPTLKSALVYHLVPDDEKHFREVNLALQADGLRIEPTDGGAPTTVAWSPFALVQACRLHTQQADKALAWCRLFKVSVFQHGVSHFFACWGEEADAERARWVAEISRALRVLTHSLFPHFQLRVDPLPGATWTATRLVAGYLAFCENGGVSCVYCELHAHLDSAANFVAYEDEYCETRVMRLDLDMHTCVSERVGVDCSCFSFDGYHFAARTCAEKMLWLRALSNVKIKLRHRAPNPLPEELEHYRAAITEYAQLVQTLEDDTGYQSRPLLPRRVHPRCGGRTTGPATAPGPPVPAARPTLPVQPQSAGGNEGGTASTVRWPGGSPRATLSMPKTGTGALVVSDNLQESRFPRRGAASGLSSPRPSVGGVVEEGAKSTEQHSYPVGPWVSPRGTEPLGEGAATGADAEPLPPEPSEPSPRPGDEAVPSERAAAPGSVSADEAVSQPRPAQEPPSVMGGVEGMRASNTALLAKGLPKRRNLS